MSKKGLNIQQLAQKVQAQNESKKDFLVKTEAIAIAPIRRDDGPFAVAWKVGKTETAFEMNRYMLGQVATHAKIPMAVVDLLATGTKREREQLGQLLSVRLQDNPTKRMIRTIGTDDGESVYARAFLSDRYRPIDNYDLALAVLPTLTEIADTIRIESSEVTETRMYLKVLYPEMAFDMGPTRDKLGKRVGDIVQAGITIMNSEVGAGRISIDPFILRLVCTNGMTMNDSSLRKNHVGRSQWTGEMDGAEAYEIYSEETLALDDAAFFNKVTDTIRAVLTDEGKFEKLVTRFMETKGEKIVGHPQAAVQELAKRFTFNEDESQNVLTHLINGHDLSKFGMINAVTAFARDDKRKMSYDRASELERIGGNIIELGASDWKVISEAKMKTVTPRTSNKAKRA